MKGYTVSRTLVHSLESAERLQRQQDPLYLDVNGLVVAFLFQRGEAIAKREMVWLILFQHLLLPLPCSSFPSPIPPLLLPKMQRQGEYEALVQYESLYSIANRITTSSSSSSGGSTATAKRPPLTPAPSLRASFIRSFVSRSAASSQAQSRPGLQMRNLSTRLMHKLGRSPVVVDEQASSSKTPKIGLQCLYSAENPEVE